MESMVGLGGGPREGGRDGRCVTPLEFHLSLCLSVSLFISLDSSVSVFVLSLSACVFLSLCLSPSLVYLTHCPGGSAGSRLLVWGGLS